MTRRSFALLIAVLLACPQAQAETAATYSGFPNLFNVTGVSADDVLNVRAQPDASAPILTTLPPQRTGIEGLGLSDSGTWVHVAFGETTGWVNARFLSAQPPRPAGALPSPMRCHGTEPFWGLNFPNGSFAEFERLPDPEIPFSVTFQSTAIGRQSGDIVARLTGTGDPQPPVQGTLTLRHEMCSDGMSDRSFGLSILFLLERGDTPELYSGCCSLTTP
ncbi:COG3650 family protein [Pseudoruegeria sp. SK021]|uniref:COG3650 family protein n=1 Tax=Pseudoruegeria sp. SK021 TaxID=1933035 RepID=UPI000A22F3EB|nr:SH3 domain-containing protein [Pseudoruegeria sp. SK021]OSP54684.1 hypothetical protein BV911_10995 [Pseudoruegeria sp. SK021]